jgi:hypothetical protein
MEPLREHPPARCWASRTDCSGMRVVSFVTPPPQALADASTMARSTGLSTLLRSDLDMFGKRTVCPKTTRSNASSVISWTSKVPTALR